MVLAEAVIRLGSIRCAAWPSSLRASQLQSTHNQLRLSLSEVGADGVWYCSGGVDEGQAHCYGAWDGTTTQFCGFSREQAVMAQAARSVAYGWKTQSVTLVCAWSTEPETAGSDDCTGLPADFSELPPCTTLPVAGVDVSSQLFCP
jgi:hypothetical protein